MTYPKYYLGTNWYSKVLSTKFDVAMAPHFPSRFSEFQNFPLFGKNCHVLAVTFTLYIIFFILVFFIDFDYFLVNFDAF